MLFHGDLLVMDGFVRDELLHQTDPGLESQLVNLTFSWKKQHAHSCPLASAVGFRLPSCAHGLSVPQTPEGDAVGLIWIFLMTSFVLLTLGYCGHLALPFVKWWIGHVDGHALWAEVITMFLLFTTKTVLSDSSVST